MDKDERGVEFWTTEERDLLDSEAVGIELNGESLSWTLQDLVDIIRLNSLDTDWEGH